MSFLTNHISHLYSEAFDKATNHVFLQAMGKDSVPPEVFKRWFLQQRIYQQAYVPFIGDILRKLVLSCGMDRMEALEWRIFDLLLFCLKNMRGEVEFLEKLAMENGWIDGMTDGEPILQVTFHRDVFGSIVTYSSPVLVGLTALWATEECYLRAWHNVHICERRPSEREHGSVRESLTSNWTSSTFRDFVDELKSLVNDIASKYSERGCEWKECEMIVGQILEAERDVWPSVDN